MITSLRRVLDRARAGERVELGCLGGHGRTGTALAALAVLTGHPAADAVAWTRTTYCPKAIETPAQESLIAHLQPTCQN
jgi:protein-tyrosine phosphatase